MIIFIGTLTGTMTGIVHAQCNGDRTAFTVSPSAGSPPYSFSLVLF